jgi:hypothetical protein
LDRAVQVRGDVTWTDTGIDVAAGQGLEIVATGRIETWRGIPFRDCGPAGLPAEEFGDNVILGVRHGALIGRIGRSELFEVGAQMTGRAPASGRLYLGVNDKGVENNAGSYGVTLTIT